MGLRLRVLTHNIRHADSDSVSGSGSSSGAAAANVNANANAHSSADVVGSGSGPSSGAGLNLDPGERPWRDRLPGLLAQIRFIAGEGEGGVGAPAMVLVCLQEALEGQVNDVVAGLNGDDGLLGDQEGQGDQGIGLDGVSGGGDQFLGDKEVEKGEANDMLGADKGVREYDGDGGGSLGGGKGRGRVVEAESEGEEDGEDGDAAGVGRLGGLNGLGAPGWEVVERNVYDNNYCDQDNYGRDGKRGQRQGEAGEAEEEEEEEEEGKLDERKKRTTPGVDKESDRGSDMEREKDQMQEQGPRHDRVEAGCKQPQQQQQQQQQRHAELEPDHNDQHEPEHEHQHEREHGHSEPGQRLDRGQPPITTTNITYREHAGSDRRRRGYPPHHHNPAEGRSPHSSQPSIPESLLRSRSRSRSSSPSPSSTAASSEPPPPRQPYSLAPAAEAERNRKTAETTRPYSTSSSSSSPAAAAASKKKIADANAGPSRSRSRSWSESRHGAASLLRSAGASRRRRSRLSPSPSPSSSSSSSSRSSGSRSGSGSKPISHGRLDLRPATPPPDAAGSKTRQPLPYDNDNDNNNNMAAAAAGKVPTRPPRPAPRAPMIADSSVPPKHSSSKGNRDNYSNGSGNSNSNGKPRYKWLWSALGVGRDDGRHRGEFAAVLYRRPVLVPASLPAPLQAPLPSSRPGQLVPAERPVPVERRPPADHSWPAHPQEEGQGQGRRSVRLGSGSSDAGAGAFAEAGAGVGVGARPRQTMATAGPPWDSSGSESGSESLSDLAYGDDDDDSSRDVPGHDAVDDGGRGHVRGGRQRCQRRPTSVSLPASVPLVNPTPAPALLPGPAPAPAPVYRGLTSAMSATHRQDSFSTPPPPPFPRSHRPPYPHPHPHPPFPPPKPYPAIQGPYLTLAAPPETVWLAERTDRPGPPGWDGASVRVATVAVFRVDGLPGWPVASEGVGLQDKDVAMGVQDGDRDEDGWGGYDYSEAGFGDRGYAGAGDGFENGYGYDNGGGRGNDGGGRRALEQSSISSVFTVSPHDNRRERGHGYGHHRGHGGHYRHGVDNDDGFHSHPHSRALPFDHRGIEDDDADRWDRRHGHGHSHGDHQSINDHSHRHNHMSRSLSRHGHDHDHGHGHTHNHSHRGPGHYRRLIKHYLLGHREDEHEHGHGHYGHAHQTGSHVDNPRGSAHGSHASDNLSLHSLHNHSHSYNHRPSHSRDLDHGDSHEHSVRGLPEHDNHHDLGGRGRHDHRHPPGYHPPSPRHPPPHHPPPHHPPFPSRHPHILLLNTHLDDQGPLARRNGAITILRTIARYRADPRWRDSLASVVLAGDLNEESGGEAWRVLVGEKNGLGLDGKGMQQQQKQQQEEAGKGEGRGRGQQQGGWPEAGAGSNDFNWPADTSPHLLDAHEQVPPALRYAYEATFTGFGQGEEGAGTRIDYVFVGPKGDGGRVLGSRPELGWSTTPTTATAAAGQEREGAERGRRARRAAVRGYTTLPNVFDDGVYLSDHRAVVVDLEVPDG